MLLAVTGANGFVGRNVLASLSRRSTLEVAPVSRQPMNAPNWRAAPRLDGSANPADWARAFAGADVVLHCAGAANAPRDRKSDSLDICRRVNRDGTIAVAQGAAMAGVRRIVFLSSVKVLGEETARGLPFRNGAAVAPADTYAISKAEAEQALDMLARERGIETVVLRPPLIYGPGVKGNIATLLSLIERGVWLPLGDAKRNRRSMISTDNLADAIEAALTAPRAVGRKLLISDGHDISTRELVERLAATVGRQAKLLTIPEPILRSMLIATGRKSTWTRLFGDLAVDIDDSCSALDWRPRHDVTQGLSTIAGIPAQKSRA